MEGKIIIFTAPSGAGKTTIVRHLLAKYDNLDFSISATTRVKRPNEVDGVDYHFMTVNEFKRHIENEAFVEWQEVYKGQYYGTLRSELKKVWAEGKHILFDIEVLGATNVKKMYPERSCSIFVAPPTFEILVERLQNRKTESSESLAKRIARIKKELTYRDSFDEILVNDKLEETLAQAEELVTSFLTQPQED